MKNRKLISLICALAMVFSMFSGLVVNAETAKGIELASAISEDDMTITIDATAVGTEGALSSFGISFEVPAGVEKANVTATSTAGLTTNVKDGVLTVAFLDMSGEGVEFADGKLATITITLPEALTAPFDFTLLDKSSIADVNGEITVAKGMVAATTTVTPTNMPTPKPTSPARPTAAPTEEPGEAVPTDVPASGKGIDLAASIDDTNTVITIDATAVETEGALSSFGISFNVPEGVVKDNVKATSAAGLTTNVKDGVLTVAFLDMSGEGFEFADGALATIEITLPSALTEPFAFTLLDKSSIADVNGEITVAKGMTATSVVVTPVTGEEEVKPVKTIDLIDYVADDAVDAATAAEAEGKDVYVTVDVEKKDGSKAVYGEDFTAVFNGKELTEAEFSNLISGYTDNSMADVINGLSFNIYNNDVNKVSTTVNAVDGEGNAEMIVDPTEGTLAPVKPTPAPKAPSISVSPASKTVNTGVKVTVKAEVKNPVEGGVLTATVSEGALDLVTGSGIVIDEETQAVTFTGAVKGKIVITYTYTDAEGNELAKEAKSTITIKEKTESTGSGSGSSSDTGNDGPIANGNVNTGVTGTIPGMTKFNDLGSVAWAQEAITMLAAKGVVSGRDANTFDPNANITRAEYCQILVGAIGKSQEAADCNFDDVATDAWYYHSVAVASKYGIVSGYGDGNFGPNNLITRRDMALMTMKAAQVMGVDLTAVRTLTFADADQFEYAADAVNTLANAGIINGMSETEFAPLANATRAQAAKIIYDTFVK